ncbi:hypothetical protein FC26_GL001427 [Paucilactobacillus vaccinostercus DSM 20634]|uniref:Uncharacterized protein n=1 Tax=Paucilactobacillus vaccinostercus DSM 20634 TaxID=1423813 RepID=A0A0R2A8C4_9LACO|nr:hypothetical protein FC26_GL001427 [Paucilactobacillus vaccinostercus DSM 20634]
MYLLQSDYYLTNSNLQHITVCVKLILNLIDTDLVNFVLIDCDGAGMAPAFDAVLG